MSIRFIGRMNTKMTVSVLALGMALAMTGSLAPAMAKTATTASATAPADDRVILPKTASPLGYKIKIAPNLAALKAGADVKDNSFKGEAELTFLVNEPTNTITVNALGLSFDSVVLVSDKTEQVAKVTIDEASQQASFIFDAPLAKGTYVIKANYHGKIYDNSAGLFIADYAVKDGKQRMLVTQFEPADARKLAPMWDEPDQKSVFEMSVLAPADKNVVSNAPIVSTKKEADGLVLTTFAPTAKMSSYLLFLGIGEFDRISAVKDGVEHGIIAKKGDAEQGRYALEMSQKLLGYYNGYFGVKYPLKKLDHIGVPGAGGFGAMENWGSIMYFESTLLMDPKLSGPSAKRTVFTVVAHEMAHQWFGDLVTMKWWDDLWLNEGFASWMETKAAEHFYPEWNVGLGSASGREAAMRLDARASTHPIVQHIKNPDDMNQAFDTITYQKGEAVIRMIESYLGEDAFRAGIRAYMAKHKFSNTVTDDLWTELEAASKTPVRAIAKDYTTQPGIPLISVLDVKCDMARQTQVVTVSQGRFAVDDSAKDALEWSVPVMAKAVGAANATRVVIKGAKPQTFEVKGCGPVKVNYGQTAYYRTLYSDDAFNELSGSFDKLKADDQLGLLKDSYALGMNGYAPVSRYLDLVGKVPADADPQILEDVSATVAGLTSLYKGLPGEANYKAWARAKVSPVFNRLGWDAKPGESENIALMRQTLISVMAGLEDPSVLAEVKKQFDGFVANPDSLVGERRGQVIGIVGRTADEATFNKLIALAETTKNQREQIQYLFAAASNKDSKLALRMMDYALTDKMPKQFAPMIFNVLSGENADAVWTYVMAHKKDLEDRLDPLQRIRYFPGLLSGQRDQASIDKLMAFAKANPDAAKAVAQTIGSIKQRQKSIARLSDVDAWLAKQPK